MGVFADLQSLARTVIGDGGLQKPERSSETSRKSRCPLVLWGRVYACPEVDLGAPVDYSACRAGGLRLGLWAEV